MVYKSTKDVPVEVQITVNNTGSVSILYAGTSEWFETIGDARREYADRVLYLVPPHDNLVMHVLGELGRAEGRSMAARKVADGAK